jgi:hypothetical protein
MRKMLLLFWVLAACASGNSYEKRPPAGAPHTPAASSGVRRLPEGARWAAPPLRVAPGPGAGVAGQAPGIRLVGATFVDGSPVPPHRTLRVRVLSLSLVLEQARAGLPQRYRQTLDFLAGQIERMADLLAGAEEHPADGVALDRAVAVGTDLTIYALDLLTAESRPGLGAFRHQRLEHALSWCWEGLRALREDPFWVDGKGPQAQRVHLQAWHLHDENLTGEERSAWGQAGVHAALIVSGGIGLAEFAGALPHAVLATHAGLTRLGSLLLRTLPGDGGGGGLLLATSNGAIAMGVVARGGALPLAATVELTEAEILALAQIGRLSPVALQLHLAMRVEGTGSGTPAQRARAQGLSGTNSVGGQVPPGFRSTQRWDTTRNADLLKKNMAERGLRTSKTEEVHHIVPSTHHEAEDARRIFDRYGIDINAAENGVILPKSRHHGQGLHSDQTIREITNLLQQAEKTGQRERIIERLRSLAEEIETGQFPP